MPRLSSLVQDGFDRMGERGDFVQSWRLPDYYYIVSLPSTVLRISNVVTFAMAKDDDEYANLFIDIWDKCTDILEEYHMATYGLLEGWEPSDKVKSMKIPRPIFVDRSEQNKKEDEAKEKEAQEEEQKRSQHLDPKVAKKREKLLAKLKGFRDRESKEP